MIAEQLITQNLTTNAQANGWTATISHTGNSSTFNASKTFQKEGNFTIIDAFGGSAGLKLEDVDSHVTNGLLFKEYYFEAAIPGAPIDPANTQFAGVGEALLNSMFKMSWTIELPGKIVETNADTHDSKTATWYFDYSSLSKNHTIMIHSNALQWNNIFLAGGAVLAIILLLVIVLRKKLTSQGGR